MFTISARWRSLASAGLNAQKQYIDDVVSCAFLDVIFVYKQCALAFTGFGRDEYKKQYIEDIISSAFLDVIFFYVSNAFLDVIFSKNSAHWLPLALAGMNMETQYVEVVV